MPSKSITHNFKYTKEDIENLIKGDIARQLGMETIPIISHSIYFVVDMEENDDYEPDPVFKGVDAKVEVPG